LLIPWLFQFFVVSLQKNNGYMGLTLDEFIQHKMILMKNGKPLIFVNNDGTISKVEENNN
jgi:hypothetical protein